MDRDRKFISVSGEDHISDRIIRTFFCGVFIDQILIVSFAGFVANLIGAGLYAWGNSIQERGKEERSKA